MSDNFIKLYIRPKNEPDEVQQSIDSASLGINDILDKIVNFIKKVIRYIKNLFRFYLKVLIFFTIF